MERAALLLRGIAQDHPFADGNKRTAIEVTDLVFRMNGYYLDASADEIVDFMLSVARNDLVVSEIAAWLRSHARKL